MRMSPELNHFHKIINAVDVLDASKNEVMIWVTDEGKFEVDFSIFKKSPKARMYVEENVKCGIILFDQLQQHDGEIFIPEDAEEDDYIEIAKKLISYLHLPRDQF